eukprot:Rmarinus@m.12064
MVKSDTLFSRTVSTKRKETRKSAPKHLEMYEQFIKLAGETYLQDSKRERKLTIEGQNRKLRKSLVDRFLVLTGQKPNPYALGSYILQSDMSAYEPLNKTRDHPLCRPSSAEPHASNKGLSTSTGKRTRPRPRSALARSSQTHIPEDVFRLSWTANSESRPFTPVRKVVRSTSPTHGGSPAQRCGEPVVHHPDETLSLARSGSPSQKLQPRSESQMLFSRSSENHSSTRLGGAQEGETDADTPASRSTALTMIPQVETSVEHGETKSGTAEESRTHTSFATSIRSKVMAPKVPGENVLHSRRRSFHATDIPIEFEPNEPAADENELLAILDDRIPLDAAWQKGGDTAPLASRRPRATSATRKRPKSRLKARRATGTQNQSQGGAKKHGDDGSPHGRAGEDPPRSRSPCAVRLRMKKVKKTNKTPTAKPKAAPSKSAAEGLRARRADGAEDGLTRGTRKPHGKEKTGTGDAEAHLSSEAGTGANISKSRPASRSKTDRPQKGSYLSDEVVCYLEGGCKRAHCKVCRQWRQVVSALERGSNPFSSSRELGLSLGFEMRPDGSWVTRGPRSNFLKGTPSFMTPQPASPTVVDKRERANSSNPPKHRKPPVHTAVKALDGSCSPAGVSAGGDGPPSVGKQESGVATYRTAESFGGVFDEDPDTRYPVANKDSLMRHLREARNTPQNRRRMRALDAAHAPVHLPSRS